jgi:hypothetical protein
MTVPAQTEDGKDRGEDESLASTSKVPTQPQHTGPSVTHPANHLQDVLKINEMVRVSPNDENKGAAMGSVQFAQHTNRAKTLAAVWHLAKPRVLENIHKRKINKQIHKNPILLLTDIVTFLLKICHKLM